MSKAKSHRLSDTQVQTFICDGFLRLDAGVPMAVHDAVRSKLQWMLDEDYNPGNNVLPRVPEMQQILDAPVVRGALQSVLGEDYVLHPHRFCHSNLPGEETADGPVAGAGSTAFVGWHQDSHSPLARPRHHLPRYAMLLYYPQDTPMELGPTQLIPGTQYCRSIGADAKARGLQASGLAGTCWLVHFDVAHGASLNLGHGCRHMVKFVFARVSEPTAPSWDCGSRAWQHPPDILNPHAQDVLWQRVWHWLCGQEPSPSAVEPTAAEIESLLGILVDDGDLPARLRACSGLAHPAAAAAVEVLVESFNGPEPLRQNAIYALAGIGPAAVPRLVEHLQKNRSGQWGEGAFVPEDSAYALAAIGRAALPELEALSRHDDEWVRINALFAIGEIGVAAAACLPALRTALTDPSHRVVRTALDALGQIGPAAAPALSDVAALLQTEHHQWGEPLLRGWSGADQIRVNASMALLRMGPRVPGIEPLLLSMLGDTCGYVDGFAIEALLRLDTPAALRGALHHLRTHRWDDTLIRGVRTY